ncbi:MAG: hypothetical protein RLZZ172_1665 [Bacteroidota bacterium]|jgi:gliding motility-associated-like protein
MQLIFRILGVLLLLHIFIEADAQFLPAKKEISAVCGPSAYANLKYSDSAVRNSELSRQIRNQISRKSNFANAIQTNSTIPQSVETNQLIVVNDTTNIYLLPIVIHIIDNNPEAITDSMVIAAIADLNDAFAHRGAYALDTNGADTRIQFCIAKTHPDGGLTTGITRTKSFYENNDMELEPFKTAMLNYWDPKRYVNLWVVRSVQGEIQPSNFLCGAWQRSGVGGYAAAGFGAVVGGMSTPLVAHELGHYLSLLHTFAGGCPNGDCTLEGDMVCDTPPDASTLSSPCNDPENSCATDTLSGPFRVDVRDNISNFMDYGSPCPTVFTPGQGERMRTFLEIFNAGSLIASQECTPYCVDTVKANFNWYDNLYPITGDSVIFSNSSSGGYFYKWYVNEKMIDTAFQTGYKFNNEGSYKVLLKAYNADSSCFSSYSGNVIVNCGVVARFSPMERIIASEKDVYSDPVRFWNKSYGATSYKWYVTNPLTGVMEVVSTDMDLVYDFPKPGVYSIKLEASNGSCLSESPTFSMPVEDPTPDAVISFREIDCYKKDSIRLVMEIANLGFDTIPSGLPITFYDRDPKTSGAVKLFDTYITKDIVIGKCSIFITHIVAASRHRLDTVFAVFNESNNINEKSYDNNITGAVGFQFRLRLEPKLQLVNPNTDNVLTLIDYKGPTVNVRWSIPPNPGCLNCFTPTFRIKDTTVIQGYGENIYQCPDSASVTINVTPLDATLSLDSIFCYKNDSLLMKGTICLKNNYTGLKYDLKVTYFDRDSTAVGRITLGELILPRTTLFSSGCYSFTHLVKMTRNDRVYAYFNKDLIQFEDTVYNNIDSIRYIPFKVQFLDTLKKVYRGEGSPLSFSHQGEPITRLLWTPSTYLDCNNCPSPVIKTNVSQFMKLWATTKYACTDSTFQEVRAFYQSKINLPNVFTPNGDGLNDKFYVIAGEEVKRVMKFQILNRWGELIFEVSDAKPNDYRFSWDGTQKGKQLPQGTYVYYLIIELLDGTVESKKGSITLMR